MRVRFTRRMRDPDDYASFHAHATKNRFDRLTIRLYAGEPAPLQRLTLEHELREMAGVMKGLTVLQAHKRAQHLEKASLAKLPYRTQRGEPYRESLPLLRRHQDPPHAPPRSWLRRLFGGRP